MLYINSIVISYCRYCLQVISKHGRFDEKILKHFKIIFFLFNLINSSHVFHHFFRIFFLQSELHRFTLSLHIFSRFQLFFKSHGAISLWCSNLPFRPCLFFRDGTRGLGGLHLKLGPRIISRVFGSKMTENRLALKMIS